MTLARFSCAQSCTPKGALHGHRVLSGHLPGVSVSHDHLGQTGDCLWTPADWAWIGGLFDVAMPALALGVHDVAGVVVVNRNKQTHLAPPIVRFTNGLQLRSPAFADAAARPLLLQVVVDLVNPGRTFKA